MGAHVHEADLSTFNRATVVDTCALWNILASISFTRAALMAGCIFSLTSYVVYECLHKPRKLDTPEDRELQARLVAAQVRDTIKSHSLSLSDLQDVARLEARKRVGKGELSCIAFARRTGVAVLTDDTGARKLGLSELDGKRVQSSPHLFGWLVFSGRIVDGDVDRVVEEHSAMKRHRGDDYRESYREGLRIRLLVQMTPRSGSSEAGS
jgi:hypothetical protein